MKHPRLPVTLTPETAQELKLRAKEQKRSQTAELSWLVEYALRDLKEKGDPNDG